MSKGVKIKEGDSGKSFSGVKKIRTNNINSGTTYWVPEDETKLGTKSINENGTYKASSDNLYGYSQVTVSGIGTGTYTAQEGDVLGGNPLIEGNPYGINEEGATLYPSAIKMYLRPAKTTYEEGEHIELTGGVFRGYLADEETQWGGDGTHPNGIIPHNELRIDPPTAQTDGYIIANVRNAGEHLVTYLATGWSYTREWRKKNDGDAYIAVGRVVTDNWLMPVLVASTKESAQIEHRNYNPYTHVWEDWTFNANEPQQYNGYWFTNPWAVHGDIIECDRPVYGRFVTQQQLFDALLADIGAGHTDRGIQTITVSWNRVGDGQELSTEFEVYVHKMPESGNQVIIEG